MLSKGPVSSARRLGGREEVLAVDHGGENLRLHKPVVQVVLLEVLLLPVCDGHLAQCLTQFQHKSSPQSLLNCPKITTCIVFFKFRNENNY